MRTYLLCAAGLAAAAAAIGAAQGRDEKGVRLERYSWVEAEKLLTPGSVVVVPLGAALKEHGPHLELRNDLTLVEYFADRVAGAAPVVMTPPLTWHFYPAFLEYPGSTSLTLDTARDLTVQVVRSLARYGPRRFYVLNTGISTNRPLEAAASALAGEGILMRFTNFGAAADAAARDVKQQQVGSHADELETSLMLHIDPASVDMSRAVKDASPAPPGAVRLTRQPNAGGLYSPTGTWGDPTLATAEKGKIIAEGIESAMLADIEALRSAPLPSARPGGPPPGGPPPRTMVPREERQPNGCTPGAERSIRRVESSFNVAWLKHDPEALAALWAERGDILHADDYSERGPVMIRQNRAEQFRRPEYRNSTHILSFGNVRCIDDAVAVVDSKWQLRGVEDAAGNQMPNTEGQSTLVMKRAGDNWLIEAYRYNVKPGTPQPPRLLSRPGYPDKR
jgi:creatinine amidohydrolase